MRYIECHKEQNCVIEQNPKVGEIVLLSRPLPLCLTYRGMKRVEENLS